LIIDFDSTFIKDETLDEIAKLFENQNSEKIIKEIENITNQAMAGKIDFNVALKKRVSLLNFHKDEIQNIIETLKQRITKSFLKNKDKIISNKDRIFIISGGFKEIIIPIVKDYGIDENHVYANEFTFNSHGYINGINDSSLLSYNDGKIRAVNTLELKNGAYVIGDGSTDLELKKIKGITSFICFIENIDRKSVSNKADFIANNLDEVFKIIENK
tara:strand:- start:2 stop:649 length:648 start_codon:yes stop_codon:yes gene_type:complete